MEISEGCRWRAQHEVSARGWLLNGFQQRVGAGRVEAIGLLHHNHATAPNRGQLGRIRNDLTHFIRMDPHPIGTYPNNVRVGTRLHHPTLFALPAPVIRAHKGGSKRLGCNRAA